MTFILSNAGVPFVIAEDGKSFLPLCEGGNEIRFIRPQTTNATKVAIDPATTDDFLRDFADAAEQAGIDWKMIYNEHPGTEPSGYNLSPDIAVLFYSRDKQFAQGDMQSYGVSWAQGKPLTFPTPPAE